MEVQALGVRPRQRASLNKAERVRKEVQTRLEKEVCRRCAGNIITKNVERARDLSAWKAKGQEANLVKGRREERKEREQECVKSLVETSRMESRRKSDLFFCLKERLWRGR